jgi:integrase/recombinase XerD
MNEHRRLTAMGMTDMPDSIDRFLASLTVNGSSPNTVRAYRSDLLGWWTESSPRIQKESLDLVSDSPDPSSRRILEQTAAEYLTKGRTHWSPNTTNRRLAALRKFGKWLGYADFLATYKPPKAAKGVAHPIPQGIEGIMEMIESARKPTHKALGVLCGLLGLRVGEALKVRPSHINTDKMSLLVHGKGDKQRVVPVHDRAYELLLPRLVRCWENDDLLVPLHDRTARRAWTSMGKRVGIDTASHDGRMTFGTMAYRNSGGDLRAVQELLGHSSSHTTETYTEIDMDQMRKAADFL